MIAIFETETCGEAGITPGDLVLYSDRLCIALNRSEKGYLLKDCNSSESVRVDKKQSLEIVRKTQIRKR